MNITTSLLAISALYSIKPTGIPLLGSSSSTNNLTSNLTNSTIPSAPLYNNVSAGVAWVIPDSDYDLRARGLTCECFDPDLKCCMPASASMEPFCIAQNASCCSDTYCNANQTCCGDACCASGFSCTFQSQGPSMAPSCCPTGQHCTSPPICFDATSTVCSDPFTAAIQCCPPALPYCRSFKPYGMGCYASAAGSATFTSTPLKESSSRHQTNPTIIISYSETTTETASLVPMPSGAFSLSFPTHGPQSAGGLNVSTTFVLTFAPNSTSSKANSTVTVSSRNSTAQSHTVTTTTNSHPITTSSTSSKSTLCFNVDIQSPAVCPSTSADDGGFPGASTVSSGMRRFRSLGLLVWLAGGLMLFIGVA